MAKATNTIPDELILLKEAMSLSHLGYWVWDRKKGRVLLCSEDAAALFDLTAEGFLAELKSATRVAQKMLKEDRSESLNAHKSVAPLKKPVGFRFRLQKEDGTVRHIWEAGKVIACPSGKTEYYIASLQDITGTRQREEELTRANEEVEKQADTLAELAQELDNARRDAEESRERFELAVSASADGVWDWNLETGESEYSELAVRILRGTSDHSQVGQSAWPEYLHPDDREQAVTQLADHLAGRTKVFEFEHRVRHVNGTYHWVRAKGKAIRREDGSATRVLGTVHPLDAEKSAEEALKDSERRYRTLVDGSIQGILIHRNYKPLFANAAYARMLGYSSVKDFMNIDSLLKLVPKDLHGRLRENWIKSLAGKMDGVLMRGPVHQRDGTEIKVESIGTLIEWDGEPAFQMTSMDVTQVRAAEMAVEEKNVELERLIREKDVFMSILAHDLRSPFTGLLGFSDFLAQKADTLSPEKVKDYARAIHTSGQNTYALLDNLLSWARLQLDHLEYSPEQIHIKKAVDDVLEETADMAAAKQVVVSNQLRGQKVFADPTMLRVLLRNLVNNAIKFSKSGGEIEITSGGSSKNQNVFKVADHGLGMTKAKVAELFEFSHLKSEPGTAGETGTGLGLMLCKEIIDRHGGHIEVESTYRKGTTFSFSLPQRANVGAAARGRGS